MRYRLTSDSGQLLDDGEGTAALTDGALVVSPRIGQPLRIRPADVLETSEPEPYTVQLRLVDGGILTLTQVGPLRTQLLAELGRARADDLSTTLLLTGVGTPETFPGAVGGTQAELRLYDDALVVIPDSGDPLQIPYAFIEDVTTDATGYQLTVDLGEGETVQLARLARRTSEFLDLLRSRVTEARGRTSAFLSALLPGLGPLALRSAAGLLRDGLAARKSDLDGIDPGIWPALIASVVTPDRRANVETLCAAGDAWLGFKQQVSAEREGEGGTEWTDHSIQPDFDHDSTSGGFGGMQGMMTAALVRDRMGGLLDRNRPDSGMFEDADRSQGFSGMFNQSTGNILALSMLGMASGGGLLSGERDQNLHTIKPRTSTDRPTLIPDSTDLDSLTASGEAPTILAFLFVSTPTHAVYEVLNQGDHATYVYRLDPRGVRPLNRAMALLGFRVEAIYAESGVGSTYATAIKRLSYLHMLREAYTGRVIHTDTWADKVRAALAGGDAG